MLVLNSLGSLAGVVTAYWLEALVDDAVRGDRHAAVLMAVGIGLTAGVGMTASSSAPTCTSPC